MERALEAEMAQHLGHAKNVTVTNPAGNTRNGKKTFKDDFDKLPIEVPHDRHASFAPQIVTKHQPAGVALTTKFSCSFMDELFSGRAYCKRTDDEVLQSVRKLQRTSGGCRPVESEPPIPPDWVPVEPGVGKPLRCGFVSACEQRGGKASGHERFS